MSGAARAGFGRVELPVAAGCRLVGYPDRAGPAVGVHDPLHARALVVEGPDGGAAVCAVELCCVGEDVVAAARARIARETGLPGERVFISATHTHSGPDERHLDAAIAEAVGQAYARLRPARVGAGWGMLHGRAMNRRRFEDPVDPAVFVVRVDDLDGRPLGLYCGFGCHPVVLGPDNQLVSGDWPGSCARLLEARLDAVALVVPGACADVNPLTAGVRARLRAGATVAGTADASRYYGPQTGAGRIGDRAGGTFAEAEALGAAVAGEALRVRDGIVTGAIADVRAWRAELAAGRGPLHPRAAHLARDGPLRPRAAPVHPLELMTVGLHGPGVLLVGLPGEVFARTGARLRRQLRGAGVEAPFVVGYANGWRGYLPPADAYADGGYEVEWARRTGLRETIQDDVEQALAGRRL